MVVLSALTTISSYIPVFRARLLLWRLRKGARARTAVVVVLQSYTRMWLARRSCARMVAGITRLQVSSLGPCLNKAGDVAYFGRGAQPYYAVAASEWSSATSAQNLALSIRAVT